jgi:flagellar hook-associated protein FlgK
LQDSLSGVDQNEEEANLARFENTTSALTKFVSTVSDMLSSLIETLSATS